MPGIYFINKFYKSTAYLSGEKRSKGEIALCDGAFMIINDRNDWRPVETQLYIMDTLNRLYPDTDFDFQAGSRLRMCTDEICDTLERGESLAPVIENWKRGAEKFEKERHKYLLY